MKTILIFVSENTVTFKTETENKLFQLSEYGISANSPQLIGGFVTEVLKKTFNVYNNITLLLDDNYLLVDKKVSEGVKTNLSEKCSINESDNYFDFESVRNSNQEGLQNSLNLGLNIQSDIEYYDSSSIVPDFNNIPLLKRYYTVKTDFKWNISKTESLLKVIMMSGYSIVSIIPYSIVLNKVKTNYSVLSIGATKCFLSVFKESKLIARMETEKGLNHIINKVSNQFDISVKNSKILIDNYSFIFLPAKYLDFVIDIPVYGDLFKEIPLSDLSYILREEFKKILFDLYSDGNSDDSRMIKTEKLVLNTRYIHGLDLLTKMSFGAASAEMLNIEDVSQNTFLHACKDIIQCQNLKNASTKELSAIEAIEITNDEKLKTGIFDKALSFLNTKVVPHLLEN